MTDETPRAFIQWKNSNVCADLFCTCGNTSHYDGWFMYALKCPYCGREWACMPYIQLIPNEGAHEAKLANEDEMYD